MLARSFCTSDSSLVERTASRATVSCCHCPSLPGPRHRVLVQRDYLTCWVVNNSYTFTNKPFWRRKSCLLCARSASLAANLNLFQRGHHLRSVRCLKRATHCLPVSSDVVPQSVLQDFDDAQSSEFAGPVHSREKNYGERVRWAAEGAPETDPGLPVALAALPFGLSSANELRRRVQKWYDKIYFGDALPPVGSHVMSYARFLDLLEDKRVKRMYILGEGQIAIVELPAPGWGSDYDAEVHDRSNPEIAYYNQRDEWKMEKVRYYVELPADVWSDGYFMHLIKEHQPVKVTCLEARRMNLLRENQVTPELVVLDSSDTLTFLNEYGGQLVPLLGLVTLRGALGGLDWLLKKLGRKKKSKAEELREEMTASKAREFNVQDKSGKKQSTGVTYKDVAGIDRVLGEIEECMSMLLGEDSRYVDAGAKAPRGILLEGPPGTGKTYLARAMAGEHGIPFYSANGAEFVEMFQGIAAARIKNLFRAARKHAPAIVFIDEVDAIGKRRSSGLSDSGSAEREQGLLQLLCEMDGFTANDKILVIGATNRVDILDDALVRPGRFDRTIYMGRPTARNRKKILQVHARNKPIPRDNDDALLGQVAELTVGYSGAELANLLNEAAILAVRRNKSEIDLTVMLEAMEKMRVGMQQLPLPNSQAKMRLATVVAGRAVAFATTPGLPPIERVSIVPRPGSLGQILYVPQEFGKDGGDWHRLNFTRQRVNAVNPAQEPLTMFELCAGLLVPLHAARATEEIVFGKAAVSTSTSSEMAAAEDLARYLVVNSTLHPKFRDVAMLYAFRMAGRLDPTTQNLEAQFVPFIQRMMSAARSRALALLEHYRDAVEQVADELVGSEGNWISGARLVEIIDATDARHAAEGNGVGVPTVKWEDISNGVHLQCYAAAHAGQASFHGKVSGHGGTGVMSFSRNGSISAMNGSVDMMDELLENEDWRRAMAIVIGSADVLELKDSQTVVAKVQEAREVISY